MWTAAVVPEVFQFVRDTVPMIPGCKRARRLGDHYFCRKRSVNQFMRISVLSVAKSIPVLMNRTWSSDVVRIVCISDTHSREPMMPAIPPGDVLIHAGDFSSTGTLPEVTRFRQFVDSLPHAQKIVIAGNHDITLQPDYYKVNGVNFHGKFFRQEGFDPIQYAQQCRDVVCPSSPAYTYLQDSSTTIVPPAGSAVPSPGIEVYGAPWQPEFYNWAFNLYPGTELKEKWDLIPDSTDVLITHGPPRMILDRVDDGTFTGCAQLRDAIVDRVKPRLHIFGHIHEGYGMWLKSSISSRFAQFTILP